jgi:hypothetical protein
MGIVPVPDTQIESKSYLKIGLVYFRIDYYTLYWI